MIAAPRPDQSGRWQTTRGERLADMWRVDDGLGEGCPPGTMVAVQRSPDRIQLVRPMVGAVLTLGLDGTQEEASSNRLRLTNVSEGIDVRLSRAAAPYQVAVVPSSVVVTPAPDEQRTDVRLRSFLRRFAIGAAITGASFYALVVAFTLATDLPVVRNQVLAGYTPESFAQAVQLVVFYLLIGFGLIGLPLGWFLRGAGVLGGAVGVWLTGFLPSGDRVAISIDPLASHLDRVDLDGVGAAAGFAIFGILGARTRRLGRREVRQIPIEAASPNIHELSSGRSPSSVAGIAALGKRPASASAFQSPLDERASQLHSGDRKTRPLHDPHAPHHGVAVNEFRNCTASASST